jgi:hypothetical protein
MAAGLARKTIRNGMSVLRRVLTLLEREGLVNRNPASNIGELIRRVDRASATEVAEVGQKFPFGCSAPRLDPRRVQAMSSVRGGEFGEERRSWEFALLNSTAHGTRGRPSHFTPVATSVGLQTSWVTPIQR